MKSRPALTDEMREQGIGLTKAIAAVLERAREMEIRDDIIFPVLSNILVDIVIEEKSADKQVFMNYLSRVWEIKEELNKGERK